MSLKEVESGHKLGGHDVKIVDSGNRGSRPNIRSGSNSTSSGVRIKEGELIEAKFNINGVKFSGFVFPFWQQCSTSEDEDGNTIYSYLDKDEVRQEETHRYKMIENCGANYMKDPLSPRGKTYAIPTGKPNVRILAEYLKKYHGEEYDRLYQENGDRELRNLYVYPDCFSIKFRYVNDRVPNQSFETLEELKEVLKGAPAHQEEICKFDKFCRNENCPYNHTSQTICPMEAKGERCNDLRCHHNHKVGRVKWVNYMTTINKIKKLKAIQYKLLGDENSIASDSVASTTNELLDDGDKVESVEDQVSALQEKIDKFEKKLKVMTEEHKAEKEERTVKREARCKPVPKSDANKVTTKVAVAKSKVKTTSKAVMEKSSSKKVSTKGEKVTKTSGVSSSEPPPGLISVFDLESASTVLVQDVLSRTDGPGFDDGSDVESFAGDDESDSDLD